MYTCLLARSSECENSDPLFSKKFNARNELITVSKSTQFMTEKTQAIESSFALKHCVSYFKRQAKTVKFSRFQATVAQTKIFFFTLMFAALLLPVIYQILTFELKQIPN